MPVIRAQEPPPPVAIPDGPTVPGKEKAPQPKTLQSLLPDIRWPAQTRGPLLLVAPERLTVPADVLASAGSREGISLTTLAPLTKQKIERYGSLSVLAPLTMPVMGIPPELLQMVRIGGRFGNASALLGALTEVQWILLVSERGLGRENMTNDRQRKLWDAMLPPMLQFKTDSSLATRRGEPQELSPAQVGALRLRTTRRLSVVVPSGASWFTDEPEESSGPVNYISAILDSELMSKMRGPSGVRESAMTEAPYQRKKTDLDPAQLDTPVALSGVATIGELVARIAKASNIELYVDRRLGSVPVTVIAEPNQGVRAGDALAALIRATATAVRAVHTNSDRAFVLTFDRVPLAVMSTDTSDALFPVFVEQLAQSRVGGRLPDVWDRIPRRESTPSPESLWQKGEELETKPFPITELPEAWQQRVRRVVENLPDGVPTGKRDTATVQAQASMELIAPFWGNATAFLGTLPAKAFRRPPNLPLASLPVTSKTKGLQIALPRTPTERARLLALVAERGFNTLFIPLSGDTREDALFTTLVQEAQSRKITVVPTLCPLQPPPNDTSLERDLSLTGRSATEMNAGRSLGLLTEAMPPLASIFRRITERDFMTPEAVPITAFARRVASLAAVPGVTDVILAEIVAPGYNDRHTDDFDFIWTGGATPAARLAVLRRDGFDPMDLGNSIMGRMTPPLFEGGEPDGLLQKFRSERREAYLKRLDTALKATGLRARLWVAPLLDEGNITSREQYISLWQGKLPTMKASPSAIRLHDHAAAVMEGMNQQMNGNPADEEPNLTRRWLSTLFEQDKAQSFALDFSDLSLGDAMKLVEVSIAKKAP
ncbi:MAG: hypothetical protein QM758_00010 [Armatimonas sp.]